MKTKQWAGLLKAIGTARIDDIPEWRRMAELLRDGLTPEERLEFSRALRKRMNVRRYLDVHDRIKRCLQDQDENGADRRRAN